MGVAAGVLAGAGAGAVVALGAAGDAPPAGDGLVVAGVSPPPWQAPNITAKPSPRAKLTIFLFIHSSVTDCVTICN